MNTGERLKKLRLSLKKTLKEQSEIFNVSLNSVYRWEHDLCSPRNTVLKKIAAFYGVSYEWLITGDEKKENLKCENCLLATDKSIEQKILRMIGKLSENSKYNIIGYIERICVEEENNR
ncbi:MAG: helix-turn-helix transcriptional regulator [Oscillospiraceae bacterium]|nr:helix-turn-helix transcriptional regulator [Oscillospiraceae bacterium]